MNSPAVPSERVASSQRAQYPAYFKPWSLVAVDGAIVNAEAFLGLGTLQDGPFTGEVVSYPTPDRTIMVRAIPGFAGTIIEVPCAAILKEDKARSVIHYATVAPGIVTGFPLDMLRYDHAVPVNFTVTGEPYMAEHDAWGQEWESGTPFIIASASSAKGISPFTPQRWQSFGWSCTPYMVEDLKKVQQR